MVRSHLIGKIMVLIANWLLDVVSIVIFLYAISKVEQQLLFMQGGYDARD